MKNLLFSAFAIAVLTLASCVTDDVTVSVKHYSDQELAALKQHLEVPDVPYSYEKPGGFGVNNDRATLGRVLFYDKRLSHNNTISCANCHKQDKAFSDDVALSIGFDGEKTKRNSLPLAAVLDFQTSYNGTIFAGGGQARFFWDERAGSIAEQSEQTLQDPIEMGTDLNVLGDELLEEEFYKVLFDKAFIGHERNFSMKEKVLISLQEFVNSIFSANSRFDQGMQTNGGNVFADFNTFSAQENVGRQLYVTHCASCHGHDMKFLGAIVANNGLDMVYTDKGVGERTQFASDEGVFKVPMLRNIALTAPYMHDGRFATLEDVVEHYSTGIKNHVNLHPNLRDPNNFAEPKHLNLNASEKAALVDFLETLTDQSTILHERFADPFK